MWRIWLQWRKPLKQGDFALKPVAQSGETQQFLWRKTKEYWT